MWDNTFYGQCYNADMNRAGYNNLHPSIGSMFGDANDSFLGYASYVEEREHIINTIVENAQDGETSFQITGNVYDYNQDDIDYIRNEVNRRLGN